MDKCDKQEKQIAIYNIRNAHHDMRAVPGHPKLLNDNERLEDRFEIFDVKKTGVLPMRKRYRQFMNHSSCQDYDLLTNEPKTATSHTQNTTISNRSASSRDSAAVNDPTLAHAVFLKGQLQNHKNSQQQIRMKFVNEDREKRQRKASNINLKASVAIIKRNVR